MCTKERYGNLDAGVRQRQGSNEPTIRTRQRQKNAHPTDDQPNGVRDMFVHELPVDSSLT